MSVEEIGVDQQPRIGDTLRLAREARGLTLNDVSKELLVREDYLQAIENMYAGGVPKGYLSGILRSYAGYLGLPGEASVQTFAGQCGAVSQAVEHKAAIAPSISLPSKFRGTVTAAAAALVFAAMGGAGIMFLSERETKPPELVEAGAPINGARESIFASAKLGEADAQMPLTLTAAKHSWLEVRGADGTIFRSRKMAAGEVYYPRIGAGWTISARDGSAFVWHVGDIEIGPLADAAAPVYAISVDTVATEAKSIASPAFAVVGDSKPTR